MARRLMAEGVELRVWNRTRDKALDLGVEVAESPADIASKDDVIFVNLFDSAAVREVMEGGGGLLSADLRGKVIVDTTTNHFASAAEFHRQFAARGAGYLEAPVAGSVVPALKGALTVMVSGGRAAYERALPYLEKVGKSVFYLETPGLATKMKLINNLVLGALMASLAEALCFAEEAGVPRDRALEVLSAGAGNSAVLSAKKEKLLNEDFSTHFSSALMHKDLHLMHELARELRRPLFAGAVKEVFGMTFTLGLEGLDFSGVYRALKGMGGAGP